MNTTRLSRLLLAGLLLGILAMATACGQTGDLYLPDSEEAREHERRSQNK